MSSATAPASAMPHVHRLVLTEALRAPSAHNAQPWRLAVRPWRLVAKPRSLAGRRSRLVAGHFHPVARPCRHA